MDRHQEGLPELNVEIVCVCVRSALICSSEHDAWWELGGLDKHIQVEDMVKGAGGLLTAVGSPCGAS